MNNELYHFGVKGMKWGVRKKRQPSTKSRFKKQQLILESKTKKRSSNTRNSVNRESNLKFSCKTQC